MTTFTTIDQDQDHHTADTVLLTDEVLRMIFRDQTTEASFTFAVAVRGVPIATPTPTTTAVLVTDETTMTKTTIVVTDLLPLAVVEEDTMTETDPTRKRMVISSELKHYYHVQHLDDVRVIRDRQTKQSRQFGFLRFPTVQDAEEFMDRNYPVLYLYGNDELSTGDASKVRITFGRERKEAHRTEDADWICPNCNVNNFSTRNRCFRCQASRPEPGFEAPVKAVNVGDNDTSTDNTPSQFLLLRGLEPSVTEEVLVKGVSKLNKPSSTAAQKDEVPGKKVAKVASTTGDANLGAREGTLRRILLVRDRRSNESWRYGFAEYASMEDAQAALKRYNSFDRFTIASKQVLVSYIHAGVFVPVLNPSPEIERFTFSPIGNPSMKLAYWDEAAYVTELAVSMPVVGSEGKSVPKDVGGSKTKEAEKTKKRKAQTSANAEDGSAKKPAPSHLQFWSNRHAELHGIDQPSKDGSEANSSDGGSAPSIQSFADPNRHCCYLCMRQFNDAAEVNKHERLSDFHRQNLRDESKVKKATAKLEKHGIQHHVSSAAAAAATNDETTDSTPQYRDRAKERRKIYGVINKKGEQVGMGVSKVRTSDEGDGDEGGDDRPVVQSKGASLLSKMGYTAGQGLGASGEGMTAPIAQSVYVAGVGLGAQGGKVGDAVEEAERNTKGRYEDFAEKTREGARERYARLE
ncbi:hypothetical protein H2204_008593 [Knufia peltigerae]|uniref:RNA-binding protein n=1 Tax=Knufia peltigerae TaxID=1002370 RepID=A0AA38XZM2_9EURO|nr:hypothetical protein H2204_008593 [Knufia peltigerae]